MYRKIFNAENPFWKGMGRIFDTFTLNVLWLLCCIPIVTVGPSTAAFYSAMITLIRGEEGYISHDFFRAFRHNFRRNLIAGLIVLLMEVFLGVDVYICRHSGTGIYTFFMVFFAVIFVVWTAVGLYLFPILGKLEVSIKDAFILAFTLMIRNLSQTLMMLFVLVLALWFCHLLPGLIFLAFGMVCEFHSTLFAVILKPWLPKLERESDDDSDELSEEDLKALRDLEELGL